MGPCARIKDWLNSCRNGAIGGIEKEEGPLYGLIKGVMDRIPFDGESVSYLKDLKEKGTVIYALKDRSQINTMVLYALARRTGIPRPEFSAGVNMLLWQRPARALGTLYWSLAKRHSPSPDGGGPGGEALEEMILRGGTFVVPMGGSEFTRDPVAEGALKEICRAARRARPVYLVPVLLVYGRRREREKEKLVNILFGQSENTGFVRRAVTFLRYSGQIVVFPLAAVEVASFLGEREGLPEEEVIRELRSEVISRIDEEREALRGPVLKSRKEMMRMVLEDPLLLKKVEEMAAMGGKKNVPDLMKDARRYIDEIAADYDDLYIEFWYRVLSWLWNNIYDGVVVDSEGMVRIRNIAKKMPFVVIPCHRSHVDYLLLSYVFYEHHVQLPFIAAGTNMAFGPFGHIFRKSGAFFIRRSFRGNPLYGEVFARYLKTMLKEGLPIEFFIEGGRSRTGKMVMPRYGLLSMIISAYLEGVTDDVALIPVYIGYDRVIEEKSYLEELGGGQKKPERTTDVIKSSRVLRKRYGRVYVNIGEAIYLKSYLSSQEKPVAEMTTEERQRLYRKIGYEVVLSINRVSVVTPFALVSAGLLSHDRRGIGHDDLMVVLEEYHQYLLARRISLAVTFAQREKAVREALDLFVEAGFITRLGREEEEEGELEETVYSLEDDKRMNLEYYKNNILHYFIPLCFVATSMLSRPDDVIPLEGIIEDYRFFKRLFWKEFIFDDRVDDVLEVNETLAYLHDRKMVVLQKVDQGAWLEIKGRGRTNLRAFAGLIANYIESYWVVVRGLSYLRKEPRSEREWLRHLHKLGSLMFRKGEIRRAEALSQANYLNAVSFLTDEGAIDVREVPEKKDRREAKVYSIRDDRKVIEPLRRRLFRFL